MTFIQFAQAHGIVIDAMPRFGIWQRFPTTDKPRHKNGAVKWTGEAGFVQNHALMQEVAVWRNEEATPVQLAEYRQQATRVQAERKLRQAHAAQSAKSIIDHAKLSTHPYLEAKGFKEERVYVSDGKAVIPMRIGSRLVGCQLISADGEKKFLFGQECSGAQFVFDGGGINILCEGYATGLSVKAALKAIKRPATVRVCFSAGNMSKVAGYLGSGIVIADNDLSGTGETTARRIGWKYWMSETVGFDFNDEHKAKGLFAVSQSLSKVLRG